MLVFIFLIGGCAQGYYAINPSKITYNVSNNLDDITLNYRYDILNEKRDYKLARKEKTQNMKLVAVKITNNTNRIINIGNNAAFYTGKTMIYPMDAIAIKNNLRQSVAGYLFYLLLTPITFSFNGSDPMPVGLVLGPLITGSNMLSAGSANRNLYIDLVQHDILNHDIQVGETVYGLVGFKNLDYAPLTIKLINK